MTNKIYCSFCGKSNDEAQQIVTSETGSSICNECIELCRDIIGEARMKKAQEQLEQQK